MTAAFITAPASAFTAGEAPVTIRVSDGVDFETEFDYRILGPAGGE
jgi:hypothetical protein